MSRRIAALGGAAAMMGGVAVVALAFWRWPRQQIAANEKRALQDVRTFVEAERRYAKDKGGAFAHPSCLLKPADCGAPSGAAPYVDRAILGFPDAESSGYRRVFKVVGWARPREKSYEGFLYIASPLQPGRGGSHTFVGDSDGRICSCIGDVSQILDGNKLRRDCTLAK